MNTIESILGTQSTAAPTAQKPQGSLGKDDFLRLLVTQMRHQDPMNPMDGQQFAAQLAQFSSVEQLMNIDKTLAAQGEMSGMLAQSVNSGVAAGLIGKTIEADGNAIGYNGNGKVPLQFELGAAAQSVTIKIRNASGAVIREIEAGAAAKGKQTVTWDGTDRIGQEVSDGRYTFEVVAKTGKNGDEPVAARTFTEGEVERITFDQNGIQLWVNGYAIPMGAVRSVHDDSTQSDSGQPSDG